MSDDAILVRIDGDGDMQPTLLVSNIITLVGAMATIVLRFWSRRISRTKYDWDDWLVFPALIFALAYFGNLCGSLTYGFGRYIGAVSFAKLRRALIGIFVGELTYAYSLTFTKFSILALYSRIFEQRWARTYCHVLTSINGAWMITATVLACQQCQPTKGFWNKGIGATCGLDVEKVFLGLGIVTIITDIALVALPSFICWRLSLGSMKKLLVCAVFLTGLFVTIASGIRIKAVLDMDSGADPDALNVTWNFSDTALWSGVEINMAIVSSCLPVLRPLIAKVIPASIVPIKLRKPSQPETYEGFSSASRKPSAATVLHLMEEGEAVQEAEITSPEYAPNDDLSGRSALRSDESSQGSRARIPTRPPTPPPKDDPPEMKAALTRPPSWNMDFSLTNAQSMRRGNASKRPLEDEAIFSLQTNTIRHNTQS